MLKFDVFHLISGVAEGPLAIGMLTIIALAVIGVALVVRLRWQTNASRLPKTRSSHKRGGGTDALPAPTNLALPTCDADKVSL